MSPRLASSPIARSANPARSGPYALAAGSLRARAVSCLAALALLAACGGAPGAGGQAGDQGPGTAEGAGGTTGLDNAQAGGDAAAALTLSTSCTGLVPASLGSHLDVSVGLSDVGSCIGATIDGLSGYTSGEDIFGLFEYWNLWSPTGTLRTTMQYHPRPNSNFERDLYPQQSGFLGLDSRQQFATGAFINHLALRAYSHSGALAHETVLLHLTSSTAYPDVDRAWSVANDRHGGGVAVTHVSLPGDGTWHLFTQRFTSTATARAALKQLATGTTGRPQLTVSGVTSAGLGLIAWDNGSSTRAIWTDANGTPTGGTFALPGRLSSGAQLVPLLDGSLALQVSGSWRTRIAPGAHAGSAVPAWLSSRPNATLFTVRGGRGYALIFPVANATLSPLHVAIFAPAGNRCGGVDLASARPDGAAISGEVGIDGTVTVESPTEEIPGGLIPAFMCRQRFYKQLLR